MSGRRARRCTTFAVASLLVTNACATGPDERATDEPSGEVVVMAAASLTDAFEDLAAGVASEHPGLEVVLNLAGSQVLAGQLVEGAAVDVFAAADTAPMDLVADAGLVDDPHVFATNGLAIAVEPGNPHGIDGLSALADPGLVVVLPAPEVPAGTYAGEALDRAGVTLRPASLERDVRAALAKVVLGEADAAIVYRSDVLAEDERVDGVPLPPTHDVEARYPIAVLRDAPNHAAAQAFVDHVLSSDGQRVLERHGFGAP